MLKIRPEIEWFSQHMERKLALNDWKGGWQNDSHISLLNRLYEEVYELVNADTCEEIVNEAADVANIAMMIADNRARVA